MFNLLRTGERQIILKKLIETKIEPVSATIEKKAQRLERAIYNQSVRILNSNRGEEIRDIYLQIYQYFDEYIEAHDHVMEDYLLDKLSDDEIVADSVADKIYSPREEIQKMFIRSLTKSQVFNDKYKSAGSRFASEIARKIETSCYNAAVRISKDSDNPPRRQWDSPAFVDIYSTRCGTINNLLDGGLLSCKTYGSDLIDKICSGEIAPENIGDMSAAEICPAALAAERSEIDKRNAQKIELKVSTLFRCYHCGAKKCQYREVQRRALDECPDYICLCLVCNKHFNGVP